MDYRDYLLHLKLDFNFFQLVSFRELYGTLFHLRGKFESKKKGRKKYLKSVELDFTKISGLINYSLSRIIVTKKDSELPGVDKEINVGVELRAFDNNASRLKINLSNDIEISANDIVHVEIQDQIVDLDIKDDIEPCIRDYNHTVICRSRIIE